MELGAGAVVGWSILVVLRGSTGFGLVLGVGDVCQIGIYVVGM